MQTATKEKLKIHRVRASLTQEQLAAKTGVTARTIGKYESCVNNLRKAEYETIEKLAHALGVNVDDIFLG